MTGEGGPRVVSGLLTTVEAADYVRLSKRTLEKKRRDGSGPRYLKIAPGRASKVLYRLADLEEWLESLEYQSTAEYDAQHR